MFIKQVKEFDVDSHEADLIITDGEYELMCYCHPIDSDIKQGTLIQEISSLFAKEIMRVDNEEYLIRKSSDYYSYYLKGKVIDKQQPLISIGNLKIKLDQPLAKDINQNDFVEFEVERLNCRL